MILKVFRIRTLAAFAAGAAVAYFLDPGQGYDRRERAIGRLTRFAEATEDVVEQVAEATGAEEPGADGATDGDPDLRAVEDSVLRPARAGAAPLAQSPPGPRGGSSLS